MFRVIKGIYLTSWFYLGLAILCILFILGAVSGVLFYVAIIAFIGFAIAVIFDIWRLFKKVGIVAERKVAERLSNGDDNPIDIPIENQYEHEVHLKVVDEIPIQFQRRDIEWKLALKAKEKKVLEYKLRPVKRGIYDFGTVNIFARTVLGLVERRYRFDDHKEVPVYPSYLQMRKYEIAAISKNLTELGIKKVRRLGSSLEFEQIKNYVPGDDPRNLNWKASARTNTLMVNQYQDEKSQQVYSLIDKGRLMQMPFNQMTLLDYAINATLVISNIAIKKGDKAGFISFSNKLSSIVTADKKPGYMSKILEGLYAQKTRFQEANFELLSAFIRRKITQRSLLLLYTNFESLSSMQRQLPYFKLLAKSHVLIVLFFRNTGIKEMLQSEPKGLEDMYHQTIAEHTDHEKKLMIKELRKYGIYGVLTEPQNLTVDTINKYLEVRARNF